MAVSRLVMLLGCLIYLIGLQPAWSNLETIEALPTVPQTAPLYQRPLFSANRRPFESPVPEVGDFFEPQHAEQAFKDDYLPENMHEKISYPEAIVEFPLFLRDPPLLYSPKKELVDSSYVGHDNSGQPPPPFPLEITGQARRGNVMRLLVWVREQEQTVILSETSSVQGWRLQRLEETLALFSKDGHYKSIDLTRFGRTSDAIWATKP